MNRLILLAGGSGVGKTTALKELQCKYHIQVLHQDDFIVHANAPITIHGRNNDHPDVVDWSKLIKTAREALAGGDVILEGTMVLWNRDLRQIATTKLYLDLSDIIRIKRRKSKTNLKDYEYIDTVLLPMHKKYVESSKKYADVVLDINNLTVAEIAEKLREVMYKNKYS